LPASNNQLDVLIIGAGITGLSCAYHLKQRGYKKIALLADPCNQSISLRAPGYALPGMADHFTRLSHGLGQGSACRVWRFGDDAFTALHDFCDEALPQHTSNPMTMGQGRRLRVATHKAELEELRQAQNDMLSHGFDVGLLERSESESWLGVPDSVVLEEMAGSYLVDMDHIFKHLGAGQQIFHAHALRLQKTSSGTVKVEAKGASYEALMVVLACHLETQRLAPDLPEDILIPYADQWVRVEANLPKALRDLGVGTFITTDFGYYALCIDSLKSVCLIGGRQFRHLAGIGEAEAKWNERSFTQACKRMSELFPGITFGKIIVSKAMSGCRPCDDMPLIGPLAGMPQILVAAGFIGQGLTQGFYAGACLASLIDQGSCATLPRDFYPERFRRGHDL